MMPELGGDKLCSTIKGDLETSHIPVILLTALGDEKNMLEGLAIGADAYITKPFSVGILKATVKTYLQIVLCSASFIIVLKIKNKIFQLIAPVRWIGNS